jgi:DNA polymerase-3 subunit epsilon
MRQIFLDTETTGLSAESGDRIVEIGCIELDNRRPTGRTLHHYVNPQRSSHPDAVRVHGITDEFLADKPPFASIADELLAFVEGAEVIIHNAAFDVAFLDAELTRLKRPRFGEHAARVSDSLLLARELFPGKGNSLDALCKRLEVDNSQRELHGALLDAGLLAEVYLRMTRGQGSLVIDAGSGAQGPLHRQLVDLSRFTLVVLEPSADEQAAHEALLADLDKASGGKTLWRTLSERAAVQVVA